MEDVQKCLYRVYGYNSIQILFNKISPTLDHYKHKTSLQTQAAYV